MIDDPIIAALRDLPLSDRVRTHMERYVALLLSRNAAMNLTAARTPEAVAEHVRDSLDVAEFVREPLIDIGSGGGFPAIPIAIATGFRVTLVESVTKKASFLSEVIEELDLSAEVVCGRAEDLGRQAAYRGHFASATARAVAGVTTVLELTIPFLEVGGVALLQRGKFTAEERIAASDAALILGATIDEEIAIPLEASDERRLVVARKTIATGPRFPRRAGVPAKRPLCAPGGSRE